MAGGIGRRKWGRVKGEEKGEARKGEQKEEGEWEEGKGNWKGSETSAY
jgi:hypothetical protein